MMSAIFIASTMLAVGIGTIYYLQALRTLNSDAESMASIAELTLKSALWDLDSRSVEEISSAIVRDESVAAVRVIDKTQTINHEIISKNHLKFTFENIDYDHYITIKKDIFREVEEIGTIEIAVSKDAVYERFWMSTLVVSMGSLILSLVLGLINYFFGIILIKRPVMKLSQEAHAIASGDLSTEIDVSRTDELGQLALDFAQMRDAIRDNIEVIKQHKQQLEEKVALRTRQLRDETQKIKAIFDALEEGIFTIQKGGKIYPEVSKSLLSILEVDQIEGYDLSSLLLDRCELDLETKCQVLNVIDSSICEEEINYISNQLLLPQRLTLHCQGKEKILDLSWRPIVIENQVESIVVSVRDITELVDLDKKNRENSEEMLILKEIMDVDASRARRVLEDVMVECESAFTKANQNFDLKNIIAKLHTFKGNARTYGLKTLSSLIHQVEEDFVTNPGDKNILLKYQEINKVVEKYQYWLGRIHAPESLVEIKDLRQAYKLLVNHRYDELTSRIAELLGIYEDQSISNFISSYMEKNLHRIASDIGTKAPHFVLEGSSALVSGDVIEAFESCLMHMIRNSLDHGLKNASEVEEAKILIAVKDCGSYVEVLFQDSGQGVQLGKLKELAAAQGIAINDELSEEDINQLLFASGFSTADSISEFSGRGVGLDAVSKSIESVGGSIRANFLGAIQNGYRKIRFRIVLPVLLQQSKRQEAG